MNGSVKIGSTASAHRAKSSCYLVWVATCKLQGSREALGFSLADRFGRRSWTLNANFTEGRQARQGGRVETGSNS